VDHEPSAADIVRRSMVQDVDVVAVTDGEGGIREVERAAAQGEPFDAVIFDFEAGGVEALDRIRAQGEGARVIVTAGSNGGGDAAALGMRHGAFDFIGKPLNPAELRLRVERALRDRRTAATESLKAAAQAGSKSGASLAEQRRPRKSDVIIGGSQWIKELYERISMVAPTDVTVAIYGESGTGKELVARTIHNLSPRYERPFVVVNCGAIPESLLEDELFGHVRGAFTDASKDREGLFTAADGGTIFLDEIGELPLSLQVKLLRVLQSQEFRRIGDDRDLRADVRVITATNRDLEKAVAAGAFREDLYYRIQVFPLRMLPLRERPDDIPLLAQHFLLKHKGKVGKRVEGFSVPAIAKLMGYHWPGNVRELENKVHHALVLAGGSELQPEDIQLDLGSMRRDTGLDVTRSFRELKREIVESFEREYARELLRKHQGNLAAAARMARIDRKNLWSLVKKYRIDLGAYRRG
jgi:two-component system, NtrC family, response regulator HydG